MAQTETKQAPEATKAVYTQAQLDAALHDERARCETLARIYAEHLRSIRQYAIAAGVEVLANEIASGKACN